MVNIPGIDIREKLKQFIFPRTKGGLQDLATVRSYQDAPSVEPEVKPIKQFNPDIENYLDNFLLKTENDKLLKGTVDKEKSGVIKENNQILSVPFKATGDVDKEQKEIGYGHLITKDDKKNGFFAMSEDGNKYNIPYSENIKLTQQQSKDIARNDVIEKRRGAAINFNEKVNKENYVMDFYDLPMSSQIILTDYQYNTKTPPTNLPKALASLTSNNIESAKKAVEEGTDRQAKIQGEKQFLGTRNREIFNLFFKPLLRSLDYNAQDIASLRGIVKEGKVEKQMGGMVERDPYKRQPRFI